ncbi:hypothetical protein Ahy_B08g093085 [Arachis hypogaea]|uniref:Uncharacterized protein n=1 Tax=Arachis hypogaea TaxID=3818 RepID=A0A444Y560_ARAHY|nr:hypothetical protein Ahy_B08g093085 [Arachis hypogaea]
MISIFTAVGEPDAVENVLREDDDVEPATIADDSNDDIERGYLPYFSTLDLDAMRVEGLLDVQSDFGARDSQDTAGLVEFQFQNNEEVILCVKTYSIHHGVEYKVMESNHDKYYDKCKEFRNNCNG